MNRIRAFASNFSLGPSPYLFTLSAMAYAIILLAPRPESVIKMCGGSGVSMIAFLNDFRALPPNWSFEMLAFEWGVMSLAMMGPLISPQVSFVWRAVAKNARMSSAISLYLAYILVWVLAGSLLLPIALALITMIGLTPSFWLILTIALVWSISPLAQTFRNRCHSFFRVSGFGLGARLDSFFLGLRTGFYCMLSCWPWMMLPILVDEAHIAAMFLIAVYLYADRIAPAARVRWKMPPAVEVFLGLLTLNRSQRHLSRLDLAKT